MHGAGTSTAAICSTRMPMRDEKSMLWSVARAFIAKAEAIDDPKIRGKLMGWAASAIDAVRMIEAAEDDQRGATIH